MLLFHFVSKFIFGFAFYLVTAICISLFFFLVFSFRHYENPGKYALKQFATILSNPLYFVKAVVNDMSTDYNENVFDFDESSDIRESWKAVKQDLNSRVLSD